MTDMFSGLRHAQNPDIYYAALMKLASIISCVQSQLYSYRTSRTKKHASQREEIMSSLEKTLRRWKAKLPHDLDFDQEDDNDTTYIRHVSTRLSFPRYSLTDSHLLENRSWFPLQQLPHSNPLSQSWSFDCAPSRRIFS